MATQGQGDLSGPFLDVPFQTVTSPPIPDAHLGQVSAPTSESFQRSAPEQAVWDNIKTEAKNVLAVTNSGTSDGALNARAKRIDADFVFRSSPEDTAFSPLHVEPLLDQAADLLDRCLRDRTEWSEVGEKYIKLSLEIGEYAALDAVHIEEEQNGFYDHEWKLRYADYLVSNSGKLNVKKFYETAFSQEAINQLHNARIKAAWLTGLPAYLFQGQSFKEFLAYNYGGMDDNVRNHYANAASIQSSALFDEQFLNWYLQLEQHQYRTPALYDKYSWEFRNGTDFARHRTLIARRFADLKAKAATERDGLLNYSERLDAVQTRFRADFRDALARLNAVVVGMTGLYGYQEKTPEESLNSRYFDEWLLWARAAIQWIIRFTRRDQSCVFPISLRDLLGSSPWNEFLANREIGFELPRNLFDGMFFVRLRGIGLVVVEPAKSGKLWQFGIRAPELGLVIPLDGSEAHIDQTSVSKCRSNRVTNRDDRKEPDVIGVSVLHNASPIGRWRITIRGTVPSSASIESMLDDVVLDLHVVFQTPAWPNE